MKLILIVEDEHGAAEVLKLLLESREYRVAAAANGDEAIVLLTGKAFTDQGNGKKIKF